MDTSDREQAALVLPGLGLGCLPWDGLGRLSWAPGASMLLSALPSQRIMDSSSFCRSHCESGAVAPENALRDGPARVREMPEAGGLRPGRRGVCVSQLRGQAVLQGPAHGPETEVRAGRCGKTDPSSGAGAPRTTGPETPTAEKQPGPASDPAHCPRGRKWASAGQPLRAKGAGSPHRCAFSSPHFHAWPFLGPHSDGETPLGPGRVINVCPVTGLSQSPGMKPGQTAGVQDEVPCAGAVWLCCKEPSGRCPILLGLSPAPRRKHPAAGSPQP